MLSLPSPYLLIVVPVHTRYVYCVHIEECIFGGTSICPNTRDVCLLHKSIILGAGDADESDSYLGYPVLMGWEPSNPALRGTFSGLVIKPLMN